MNEYIKRIRQKYRTVNWEQFLASWLVAAVFAMIAAAGTMRYDAGSLIGPTVIELNSWVEAVLLGVFITPVVMVALILCRPVGRWLWGPKRLAGTDAALALVAGTFLYSALFFIGGYESLADISTFYTENALPGLLYLGPPVVAAEMGYQLWKHRTALPNGTIPTAVAVACILVASIGSAGAMVGMPITHSQQSAADDPSTLDRYNENRSLYVDGKFGPYYPISSERGDRTPIQDSAFGCSDADMTPHGEVPADNRLAIENTTIQRLMFDDGSLIPNRAIINFDIPDDSHVVEAGYSSRTANNTTTTPSQETSGEASVSAMTEWSDGGFAYVTVVTQDKKTVRYWAPVCSSDPVNS